MKGFFGGDGPVLDLDCDSSIKLHTYTHIHTNAGFFNGKN